MDLYTLNENFVRDESVEGFNSVIWTERYTKAGDFSLSVPPTQENIAKLQEGTFLWTPESDLVMLIETALIKDGQLKLTGFDILAFLNNRLIRTTSTHADRYWNIGGTPGGLMAYAVTAFVQAGGFISTSLVGIDGAREVIPGFGVWSSDNTGASVTLAVPYGPLYDALVQIAETYQVGQKVYLDRISAPGFNLLYKTYRGKDRTSAQSVNDIVVFSPKMDSLTDISELRSISGYKNVAYAFAPSAPPELVTGPGVAYADGAAATSMGFNRRVLMTFEDDLTTDKVGGDPNVLLAMLNQRAKDALANNNYTKVVDGEVVPQTQFQYGKHYGLGDIVELQSPRGFKTNARITEYIRSQDSTGERAYPTVTVID